MLENYELEKLDSELRIQAAGHQPRLAPEATIHIQKRVYGHLRRAIVVQHTVKPSLKYLAIAILFVAVYYFGINLLNPPSDDNDASQKNPVVGLSTRTPVSQSATVTPTPTSGPTIVKFYFTSGRSTNTNIQSEDAVMFSLIQTYNASHPDTTISLVQNIDLTTDDLLQSFQDQVDCYTWYAPYTYQSTASMLDLTPLVTQEGPDFLNDFDPAILADFQRQDKLFALPATSATFNVMSYNIDLLNQLGLQPPSQYWTFSEFLDYLEAVANAPGGYTGFIYNPDFLLQGLGVQWVDPATDPLQIFINSPTMKDALAWMVRLENAGAIRLITNENQTQVENEIVNGKVAFWISDANYLDQAFLNAGVIPGFQVGTVTMPVIPGYQYPYYGQFERGYYISATSHHVQACWSLIKYLSSQSDALGGIPARLSLRSQWEASVGTNVYEIQYERDQRYDYNLPYNKIYDFPLYYWVEQAIRSALLGKNIEGSLDIAQTKAKNYQTCWASIDTTQYDSRQIYDRLLSCAQQVDPEWPITPSAPVPSATPTSENPPAIVKYFDSMYGSSGPDSVSQEAVMEALIAKFNDEHSDIQIKLVNNADMPVFYGQPTIEQVISRYDCFTWPLAMLDYYPNLPVLDLSALMQAEGPDFESDFDPAMLADFTSQDKLLALPAGSTPIDDVIFYNRSILTQLSLPEPTADWTFTEFLADIQAVGAADTGFKGFAYTMDDFMLQGLGANWVDPASDPLDVHMDSSEMNAALATLIELNNSGALVLDTDQNGPEVEADIRAGKVAFWISSNNWLDTTFQDQEHPINITIGNVPMPVIPGYSYPYNWQAQHGNFITAGSPNAQACWTWFKFLSESPEAFGGVPVRLSVRPAWEAYVGTSSYETQYNRSVRQDDNTLYARIGSYVLNQWLQQAIQASLGGETPEQALATAQNKADAYLACWAGQDPSQYNENELWDQIIQCAEKADPNWLDSP